MVTGSQAFSLMELAQESLAGRVAILHMSALSQAELYGTGESEPFVVDMDAVKRRMIKTPKMYFFDTGLVAYLAKFSSPEILMNGAMNGAILENYVVAEIIKTYRNNAKDWSFYYYRDKDAKEIDLVFESDGCIHPVEVKKSMNPGTEITGAFTVLDKASVPRGRGAVLCLREEMTAIDRQTLIIPIWAI